MLSEMERKFLENIQINQVYDSLSGSTRSYTGPLVNSKKAGSPKNPQGTYVIKEVRKQASHSTKLCNFHLRQLLSCSYVVGHPAVSRLPWGHRGSPHLLAGYLDLPTHNDGSF